jgi:hypothetical protein
MYPFTSPTHPTCTYHWREHRYFHLAICCPEHPARKLKVFELSYLGVGSVTVDQMVGISILNYLARRPWENILSAPFISCQSTAPDSHRGAPENAFARIAGSVQFSSRMRREDGASLYALSALALVCFDHFVGKWFFTALLAYRSRPITVLVTSILRSCWTFLSY